GEVTTNRPNPNCECGSPKPVTHDGSRTPAKSLWYEPCTRRCPTIGTGCPCRSHRLRGWGERTRTRKCRFTKRWAELLGFPEHFPFRGRRDRDPCRSRPVKATFASSSPLTPATESVSPAHLSHWESQEVRAFPCPRQTDRLRHPS